MDEPASRARISPKRKRKLETTLDFDAFARVGKQLQEDLLDLKDQNQALNLANEQLSNDNRLHRTSLLVQETRVKAKDDTIKLLQQTLDTVMTEKQVMKRDYESVKCEFEDLRVDNEGLREYGNGLEEQIESYEGQMIEKDAELANYRRDATRLAEVIEDNERTKVLLKRTQGMHSEASGELRQARESIGILKKLVEVEPTCVFCIHSESNGEYVDSKCKRCSVFYHKTCRRSSITKCPQCQLEWMVLD